LRIKKISWNCFPGTFANPHIKPKCCPFTIPNNVFKPLLKSFISCSPLQKWDRPVYYNRRKLCFSSFYSAIDQNRYCYHLSLYFENPFS
jgi:hypothetical protein